MLQRVSCSLNVVTTYLYVVGRITTCCDVFQAYITKVPEMRVVQSVCVWGGEASVHLESRFT